MAQKKVQLKPLSIGTPLATPIPVDIAALKPDFDPATVLALRAFVKPTLTNPGYFSAVGQFTKGGATVTGIFTNQFGNNATNFDGVTYTPQERGFHILVLTGVEGGVGHAYRSGVIRVS